MENQVAERGKNLYASRVRDLVERPENVGKIVALDVESADYEVDGDLLAAGDRVLARRPEASLWFTRIGYNAAFAVGGTLTRG